MKLKRSQVQVAGEIEDRLTKRKRKGKMGYRRISQGVRQKKPMPSDERDALGSQN